MFDTIERAHAVSVRAGSRSDLVAQAAVGATQTYTESYSDSYGDFAWWRYLVGAGAAYHGYVRNNSVGWAIGWYFAGFIFPWIAIPVAAAQMMLDKKKGS